MTKSLKANFPLSLLVIILMAGFLLVGVNKARATTVNFPQDTTWAADNGNITIQGNSEVDEITTSGTVLTVTVSAGQSIILKSPNRLLLINNHGLDYLCDTNESRLTISVATGGSTKIVTVTPSSTRCDNPVSSGGGGGGGSVTSTPTPSPVSTSSPQATPTPTVTPISVPTPSPVSAGPTPASKGFINLTTLKLKEGDVISAAGSDDPDVYIVNDWGYKRLFLNPAIFGFYGHLGGFSKVKTIVTPTRDTLVTSGLFRNCETNDEKVYGVETTGEDTGILHWLNTTGAQAVADDPDFFKKVFCINSNEFNWYKKSVPYTSVNQIPSYTRIFNK